MSRVRDSAASPGTSRANALSSRRGGSAPISTRTRRAGPAGGAAGVGGVGTEGAAMGGTPDDEEDAAGTLQGPDAAALRFLRALVTALTAVMILGILAIVALLVIRLPDAGALSRAAALSVAPPETLLPETPLPETLHLPDGARALALTQGPGWFAVVTDDDRILIYGTDGALRQAVRVESLGVDPADR